MWTLLFGTSVADAATWDEVPGQEALHSYYRGGGSPGGFARPEGAWVEYHPANVYYNAPTQEDLTGKLFRMFLKDQGGDWRKWMEMGVPEQDEPGPWVSEITEGLKKGLPSAVNATWAGYLGDERGNRDLLAQVVRPAVPLVVTSAQATLYSEGAMYFRVFDQSLNHSAGFMVDMIAGPKTRVYSHTSVAPGTVATTVLDDFGPVTVKLEIAAGGTNYSTWNLTFKVNGATVGTKTITADGAPEKVRAEDVWAGDWVDDTEVKTLAGDTFTDAFGTPGHTDQWTNIAGPDAQVFNVTGGRAVVTDGVIPGGATAIFDHRNLAATPETVLADDEAQFLMTVRQPSRGLEVGGRALYSERSLHPYRGV